MAEYDLDLNIKAKVDAKPVEELNRSLETTKKNLDNVSEGAKETKKEMSAAERAIKDAAETAQNTSKLEAFRKRLNGEYSKLAQLMSADKVNEGAVGRSILGIKNTLSQIEKLETKENHLEAINPNISADQASKMAKMASEADILRTKLNLAAEELAKLYNEGGSSKDVTRAVENVRKWSDKLDALMAKEREQNIPKESPSPINMISPTMAGQIAENTSKLEILEAKAESARRKLADLFMQNADTGTIARATEQYQKLLSQIEALKAPQVEEVAVANTDVEETADQATVSTSRLERAMSSLRETAVGVAGEVGGRVVSSLQSYTKGINTFLSSVKRILFYRMIRTVLKDIGQAFKTGVNDMYQWSKTASGVFAQSMDKLATSSLYAKNSLGAMVAPILNALAPAVEHLTDMFVSLLNVINQVLSLLSGATTWTKAVKFPKEYAKAAGGAAKAAKDFGLAQIDQLTILSKQNSSGGSGFSAEDYAQMFEETSNFNKKLQDLIGNMKINFNDVFFKWDNLTPEDIAKKAIVGLGAFLGGAAGFIIGGVPGAVVGTLTGVTMGLLIDSLIFDNDGVLSRMEVAEMLKGALFTLAGGAIGFSVGGVKGALIGASVGMSLYAGLKTLDFFKDGAFTDIINQLVTVLSTIGGAALGFKLGGIGGALVGATIGLGLSLAVEKIGYKDASGWNTDRWAEEIVSVLAPGAGAAIGLAVGGVGGALVGATIGLGIKFLLDTNIFSTTDNAGERLNRITKGHLNTSKTDTESTLGTIQQDISKAYQGIEKTTSTSMRNVSSDNQTMWDKITNTIWNAGVSIGLTNDKEMTNVEKRMALFGSRIYTSTDTAFNKMDSTVSTKMGNMKTTSNSDAQQIQSNIDRSWNSLKSGTSNTWNNVYSTVSNAINRIKNLTNFSWSLPHIKLPHFRVSGSFGWTWGGGITMPSISVDWYKNGGFPDAGQLFIANEAGPEMVGTMGGRTAVANNGQIVTGIREGVYDAMMSAMQSGSFKADVYIDGKRVTDTVVSNINSQTRRTGSSPLLV